MTDLKNNLDEVLEINPMNNKKYIEAVSFRDWQTCDLICDEHSVLVDRIKFLEQELQKAQHEVKSLKSAYEKNINSLSAGLSEDLLRVLKTYPTALPYICEIKQELQKTREQLEKAEKVIGFYANWANYKEQVIAREDCDVVPFYLRNDELIGGKRARQYFKDKQGE